MSQDAFDLFKEFYNRTMGALRDALDTADGTAVRRAAELILKCRGKIVLSGMGKSGHIATKLAATFASTGAPAVFLHPAEALHGDLGLVQEQDVVMVVARGGESDEVIGMLRYVQKHGIPIISLLGEPDSTVGRMSTVIIHTYTKSEADFMKLAPMASSAASLLTGDALAAAVSRMRGFQPEEFAVLHPAGQLGRRLSLSVEDFLDAERGLPVVPESESMHAVLESITKLNLGGTMIVAADGTLRGIITDGDLRRAILKYGNILEQSIADIMTPKPIAIKADILAIEALRIMENRPSQISVLPVVDDASKPIGLLRLHDIIRAGI